MSRDFGLWLVAADPPRSQHCRSLTIAHGHVSVSRTLDDESGLAGLTLTPRVDPWPCPTKR